VGSSTVFRRVHSPKSADGARTENQARQATGRAVVAACKERAAFPSISFALSLVLLQLCEDRVEAVTATAVTARKSAATMRVGAVS